MIILDNIIFSLQKAGGISVVWQKLLEGVQKEKDMEYQCLEYPNCNNNIFRNNLRIPSYVIKKFSGPAILKRYISPNLKIDQPSIFHSSVYRTLSHELVKNVTTVHDFTYEVAVSGLRLAVHKWRKYRAIHNSEIIVCVSHNTAKDLQRFCPSVDSSRVKTIYNGVSNAYKPLLETSVDHRDSVLYVGARDGYKNFKFTAEALQPTKYKLLICGSSLTPQEMKFLNLTLGEARYQYLGRVTDEQLNELYNSVHCLAYPSSYEGFGIPVLEAQRAKCPVIALNASSIPEVMGVKDFLMNELTAREFQKKLKEIEIPAVREDIVNEGYAYSQRFSWEKMALEYIELYKELLMK